MTTTTPGGAAEAEPVPDTTPEAGLSRGSANANANADADANGDANANANANGDTNANADANADAPDADAPDADADAQEPLHVRIVLPDQPTLALQVRVDARAAVGHVNTQLTATDPPACRPQHHT